MAQEVTVQIRLPKRVRIRMVRKWTTNSLDDYDMAEIEYIDIEESGEEPKIIVSRKDFRPSCSHCHNIFTC